LGARAGLLVRDRRGLEDARLIDVVVFDKTGTLTIGEQRVVDIATIAAVAPDTALRLAAAVERDSEHAVARAILATAADRELDIPPAEDFGYQPGMGVSARVGGRRLRVGGPNLLRSL